MGREARRTAATLPDQVSACIAKVDECVDAVNRNAAAGDVTRAAVLDVEARADEARDVLIAAVELRVGALEAFAGLGFWRRLWWVIAGRWPAPARVPEIRRAIDERSPSHAAAARRREWRTALYQRRLKLQAGQPADRDPYDLVVEPPA